MLVYTKKKKIKVIVVSYSLQVEFQTIKRQIFSMDDLPAELLFPLTALKSRGKPYLCVMCAVYVSYHALYRSVVCYQY